MVIIFDYALWYEQLTRSHVCQIIPIFVESSVGQTLAQDVYIAIFFSIADRAVVANYSKVESSLEKTKELINLSGLKLFGCFN